MTALPSTRIAWATAVLVLAPALCRVDMVHAAGSQATQAPTSATAEGPSGHHVNVNAAIYPWSSIAKLFNSVGGSCTGAVVARDRVLTAGHCVYAFRTRRFLPPDALHILLGYDRGSYQTHAQVLRYRLGPGYDPQSERATAASDWAVLELAEPLPADIAPLRLLADPPPPEGRITIAGFARDRAYVMTADTDCQVTGRVERGTLISHDCQIEPGDSGAPLLQRSGPKGEASIVGITVGIWHLRGTEPVGIAAPVPANLLSGSDDEPKKPRP